jgi:uncharacterized protein (DUF1499 family)
VVASLALLLGACGGPRPDTLGADENGTLAPCPPASDCVNTGLRQPEGTRGLFARGSITFPALIPRIRDVVEAMPRTTVVAESERYLHAEVRSGLGRVYDLEVFVGPTRELLVRAAVRGGGAGRAGVERVEELRRRLGEAGILR